MSKKIYDNHLLYLIAKPLIKRSTSYSYRKVEVRGLENIPTDGSVIITPNHCNTLMDALVILRSKKQDSVFGARADIFKRRLIARIMFIGKIIPMVRQRDGLRNVLKNNDTQEIIVEALEHGLPFCLYPEGKHRPAHSLQPLGKGVCRVALAANTKFGDSKPVYIVPAGIEYGDYFRYRSTSLVTYGKPINVTEFIKNLNVENEAQIMDPLRKEVAARMSELITYLKDDEHLNDKWTLTKMLAIDGKKKGYGDFGTCLYDSMMENRKVAASVDQALEQEPERMKELLDDVAKFDKARRKKGVSIYSFRKIKNPVLNAIGKGLAALIGLPYWIFSAIVTLPMWVTFKLIKGKIRDKAFANTVGFGVRFSLGNILFLLYAILAFCLLPWFCALTFLLLFIPAYAYFYDYIEGMRRYISDLRLLREKKLRKTFKEIVKSYKKTF